MSTSCEPAPLQWLLLTQNIGSIECSDPEKLSPSQKELTGKWMLSVRNLVLEEERVAGAPIDIVVLHLQEIGGKKFNAPFVSHLASTIQQCSPYHGWCSGLLLPDENDGSTFTAMGTVFFASPRVSDVVSLLSFRHRVFIAASDNPLQWTKSRRALFHGAKFSGSGSSRKGYLLTTLRVGCRTFNFVNVHLFHDASNEVASQSSPSEYATKRVEALLEVVAETDPVVSRGDPMFFFGDFNFRLDISRVVKAMEQHSSAPIRLGKKQVECSPAVWQFLQDPANFEELRLFDTEGPLALGAIERATGILLQEPERLFGPTYLLETNPTLIDKHATAGPSAPGGAERVVFSRDRFPAWCDRHWLNVPAAAAMEDAAYSSPSLHPMDHRPVQLRFTTSVDAIA